MIFPDDPNRTDGAGFTSNVVIVTGDTSVPQTAGDLLAEIRIRRAFAQMEDEIVLVCDPFRSIREIGRSMAKALIDDLPPAGFLRDDIAITLRSCPPELRDLLRAEIEAMLRPTRGPRPAVPPAISVQSLRRPRAREIVSRGGFRNFYKVNAA